MAPLTNFQQTVGASISLSRSMEGLVTSLLDPKDNLNTKLADEYIAKIMKGAEEIRKQNISAEEKAAQIQTLAYKTISDIVDKNVTKQVEAAKEERELQEKSSVERAKWIVEQEKLLKKQQQVQKDEQDAIQQKLDAIQKEIEASDNLAEQKILLEEQQQLLDRQERLEADQKESAEREQKLLKLRKENQKATERADKIKLKEEKELKKKEAQAEAQAKVDSGEASVEDVFNAKGGVDTSNLSDPTAWLQKGIGTLIDTIHKLGDTFDNAFAEAEEALNTYQAKISTRLEGSGRQYSNIADTLRRNLSLSTIVEQKRVLENVGKLVESGIAYDLEQRAFLMTVAEDISSTFDAFDSNLLRIIRIQREDSTYARMGLETSLSRLFNEYFLDSSYLNDVYDSVSSALIDATSQLSTSQSAEFEYTVQKWLGALYSMGASNAFVTQIASGLNMLGTGNVQGLSGSPMQTLFAMAANRSGTDYASLLTGGLNAQNTNDLLRAMVEYLAEISGNTSENKVVAGAYSNLFNMTLSDMRAIQNLQNDIRSIYAENISYEQMSGVTNQRITTLGSNYSLGKRISTLFNNILFSSAQSIVNNAGTYILYKATDLVGKVGDAIIPTISVMGNSVNLGGTITDIIKSGIFGISMIGNIIEGLGHLGDANELYSWTTEGEMRGSGYDLTSSSSMSQSYAMNASSSDLENQTLSGASKSAKERAKTINGQDEEEEEITLGALFYGLFDNTNKEGAVSAINRNIANINTLMTASYNTDLSAQRVVISGWDMTGQNGAEFELPVRFGTNGQLQFSNGINVLPTKEMILAVLAYLQGVLAENGSVNVNLLSSDVDIADWARGNAGSDNTETVKREGGGGNNGIVRALAGSRASDRTTRFAAID